MGWWRGPGNEVRSLDPISALEGKERQQFFVELVKDSDFSWPIKTKGFFSARPTSWLAKKSPNLLGVGQKKKNFWMSVQSLLGSVRGLFGETGTNRWPNRDLCSPRWNQLLSKFCAQQEANGNWSWRLPSFLVSNNKVKSAYEPIVAHQAGAYPGFCSMKQRRLDSHHVTIFYQSDSSLESSGRNFWFSVVCVQRIELESIPMVWCEDILSWKVEFLNVSCPECWFFFFTVHLR